MARDGKILCNVKITETSVPSFIFKKGGDLPMTPPTYHRTNRFTSGFQKLVNAYEYSRYRELNPGVYTIITLPFIFGMMFGDVGHAIILIVFAVWMLINEKKFIAQNSRHEIWNIIFDGRYVILLMGVFSLYCGFIYNDLFGKSMVFMETQWKNQKDHEKIAISPSLDLDPAGDQRPTYYFGLDPIWSISSNKLIFENSIKMKLSIIVGVIHMMFGLLLSIWNHIYFKNFTAICLQFIPKFLILSCIFLWLVIMIYMKWFMYSARFVHERSHVCAPMLLHLFIDMFLMSTSEPPAEDCEGYMFSIQQVVQCILIAVTIVSTLLLIFGTPLLLHKNQSASITKEPKNEKEIKSKKAKKKTKPKKVNVLKNKKKMAKERQKKLKALKKKTARAKPKRKNVNSLKNKKQSQKK